MSQKSPQSSSTSAADASEPAPKSPVADAAQTPLELGDEELSRVAGGQTFWFPGLDEKPQLRSDDEMEGFGTKIE